MSHNKSPTDIATELLLDLDMSTPDAIDVDVVASHLDALLCYEPLSGCAGRIVGINGSAIITVDSNSSLARRRFTAAHEIGHWIYDHGKSTACTNEHITGGWAGGRENRANKFAAALLLPGRMLKQHVHSLAQVTLDKIDDISSSFRTSKSATIIRVVEAAQVPVLAICTLNARRKWFARSKYIPDDLYPVVTAGPYTRLVKYSNKEGYGHDEGMVDAEQWLDHSATAGYEIFEETFLYPNGYAYTILSWPNEEMILDMM